MDVEHEEKTLKPISIALYDNLIQQSSAQYGNEVNIEDDLNIMSNTRDIFTSFSVHDRVIFFDEHLKLWKRGEIICYIEPEYKVSWGASWNWINKNKLYLETDTNNININRHSYDDMKDEQTAIIRAVNWSYFSEFFSEYLLSTLWKSVDTKMNGSIDIDTSLEPMLHELILIFFSKSGLINNKISKQITKPFVNILKESILNNLDNNDQQIAYEEFKHFSLWIPRSLKQIFQNGLIINMNELNEFLNRHLLSEIWDKFTKKNAYSTSKTQIQIKNLIPIIHELIIRYCKTFGIEAEILNESITKQYVDKIINIIKNRLMKQSWESFITKDQFMDFNQWPISLNKMKEMFLDTDKLIVDLTQLQDYLTKRALKEIWSQIDTEDTGKIQISQLRLLLHSVIEQYAQFMGIQRLIDVESVVPLVDALYYTVITRYNKKEDDDSCLTYEEFTKFGSILGDLKFQALKAIDLDQLEEYVQSHVLEDVWDEYDPQEYGELPTLQMKPMIQNIMEKFVQYSLSEVNEQLVKSKRIPFHTSSQIFQFGITHALVRLIVPPLVDKLDHDQTGTVKKQQFMRFREWLPDWSNRFDVFNLDDLQKVITQGVLNQIWDQFDENQTGSISQKDMKKMINKVLENYVANLGAAYLLTKKHIQKLLDKLSTIIMSRFDIDSNGEITRDDFMRLVDRLSTLKQDALDCIEWNLFEQYMADKELLDKIWKEVDTEHKGEIPSNHVIDLYTKLVCKYFQQVLKAYKDSPKLPFDDISDLHHFGVIQTVSSILETHCTEKILQIRNCRKKFQRDDFLNLPQKYMDSRKIIKDSVHNATVSLASIDFGRLSKVLTSQVLNAIWSKFDDGNGRIGIGQLRSVIRELLKKYFIKVGLLNVSLDDSRMKRYIDDLIDTILEQIQESTPNNDGSITKRGFIKCISKIHGVKTLNKFVELDFDPLRANLINKLEHYPSKFLSLLDLQNLMRSTFVKCMTVKHEKDLKSYKIDIKDMRRSIIDFITMEFTQSVARYCFNDDIYGDDEMSKQEMLNKFEDDSTKLDDIIYDVNSKLDDYLRTGLHLSLLSMDLSFFGKGISKKDVDTLWYKLDPYNTGYINKPDLETLLFKLIQQYLKNKGEPAPKSQVKINDLMQRLMTNIMKYIHGSDKPEMHTLDKISRFEFNKFLKWLTNMKRIDINQIDLAWNLYEALPKRDSAVLSIISHRNSVLPNPVKMRVESLLNEAKEIMDEETSKQETNQNLNVQTKIAEISQKHLALAMADQFKDDDLVDLLNINTGPQHLRNNTMMNNVIQDIQKDMLDTIVDKAPFTHDHGSSMFSRTSMEPPTQYAMSASSAPAMSPVSQSGNALSIKGGDILSSISGITPYIADGIESMIVAKTVNRIIIAVAEMAKLDDMIIFRLKELLENDQTGLKFAEQFRQTVESKWDGKQLSITDLFGLLKNSEGDEELFVIVIESLEECLIAILNEYSIDSKEQLIDALVWNITQKAKGSFCAEFQKTYCWNIIFAILWRIIAVILIIITFIFLVISVLIMVIAAILGFSTLFCVQKLVIFYYFSIALVLFLWNIFKSGIVMIVMPSAGLLGIVAALYELAFTNLFVSKVLNYLHTQKEYDFDLNEFIPKVVNFMVDTSLIVVSKVDVAGILQQKLFSIHSDETSPVHQMVRRATTINSPRNYQRLKRRKSSFPVNFGVLNRTLATVREQQEEEYYMNGTKEHIVMIGSGDSDGRTCTAGEYVQ